jgi:hypothetical protein
MKKNYSFVMAKAEAFISNPKNRRKSGGFKSSAQRKINRFITEITYLSQFETPITVNNNF